MEPVSLRQRWESAADVLLEGLIPFRSPGGALYQLPGPRPSDNGPRVDAFEGFARSFLLAAFRIRHATPERAHQLAERYSAGLAAGTEGPEAWPRIDGLTQPLVEAAAIALGLLQTRETVWARLDEGARQRLVDYLVVARTTSRPVGNWMWFQITIELFLAAVGVGADRNAIDERLDALRALQRGDGMWSDGGGARYDYYSSWAFSFYSAFWAQEDGQRRPDIASELHKQAVEQQTTLRSLIDEAGRPVIQGRSLIYRAAVTAGLWAPALFPQSVHDDHSWVAAIATPVLDNAMRNGVTGAGLLSLGWAGAFLPLVQPYSGPGSPYWMSKAFSGLLLPEDHPAWRGAGPAPTPRTTVTAPGWLLQSHGGIVRLHNHGTWRTLEERDPHSRRYLDDPLYSRLAYSSATAPILDATLADSAQEPAQPDNAVILDPGDGQPATQRTQIRLVRLTPTIAVSTWVPCSRTGAWPAVTSWTLIDQGYEVRLHAIHLERPATVTMTGYSLSDREELSVEEFTDHAVVTSTITRSAIGIAGSATPTVLSGPAGVFGPFSATPAVRLSLPAGKHVVACSLSIGAESPAMPIVSIGRERAVISWPRGHAQVVDLRGPSQTGVEETG